MGFQAKDLAAKLKAPRVQLILGACVLVALAALAPLALRSAGLAGAGPLARLATGTMAKFVFKHRGDAAPGVVFHGPEGEMTMARLRGHPVLVNLWASWCQPCVKELPSLDRLQAAMAGDGLEVVALNMDQDKDDALYFLAKNHVRHLGLYFDPHLLMSIALREDGIPVSVLYDSSGKEVGRYLGATEWDSPEAKRLIKAAIAPASG